MTEFTRDIKQLTKTASSTPQFSAPSSSLGGDIVNLASTGLQFYQQQQAKEELGVAKEAMSKQATRMATGQERLRQVRLLSQQGVSPTDISRRENALKREYSPTEWWDILGETNKVSKVTSTQALTTADAAIQKEISERRALQEEVNTLQAYIPYDVSLDADEATLQQAKLVGQAKLAKTQAQKAELDLRNTKLTVEGKESDLAIDKFVIDFGAAAENMYVKQARNYISQANFNDPTQVSTLMEGNDNLRRMFIEQAVASANEAGIPLTPNKANEAFATQLSIFDMVDRQLSRKDVKEVGANQLAATTTGAVLAMANSDNPTDRNLAAIFQFTPFLPQGALSGKFLEVYANALMENSSLGGRGDFASVFSGAAKFETDVSNLPPPDVKARNKEKQSRFQRIADIYKNADENVPKATKDAYTDIVLEDFQGSNATQEEMLNGGGFVAYVKAMSKGTPANLLSPERQDMVMLGVVDYAEKFLRRAVPQLLTEQTPSSSDLFTKPIPPKGFNVGLPTTKLENKLNALDPDTLKVTWNQDAAISKNVKSYNKFIDELFVSLDKLGATEDEIKYLKTEVSRAFVEANKG